MHHCRLGGGRKQVCYVEKEGGGQAKDDVVSQKEKEGGH